MTDTRGDGPATVLVVDDDPAVRALVREIIEGEGLAVVARGDMKTAYEVVDVAGAPDLAVVDYQLPDGTGTELCRSLRGRGVPCLVISGYSRSLEPTMEVKADAWIGKPFETADLVRAVQELLRPSGAILSRFGAPGEPPKVLRIDAG